MGQYRRLFGRRGIFVTKENARRFVQFQLIQMYPSCTETFVRIVIEVRLIVLHLLNFTSADEERDDLVYAAVEKVLGTSSVIFHAAEDCCTSDDWFNRNYHVGRLIRTLSVLFEQAMISSKLSLFHLSLSLRLRGVT